MFADLRRRNELQLKIWWAGKLIGAGAFQLYDGTIQHKLMRIHQIRYVENVIIYDVIWNVIAIVMIIAGLALVMSKRNKQKSEQEVSYKHG